MNSETAPAPMRPGTYIQRRREAAGLTIDDVANQLGDTPKEIAEVQTLMRVFELDNVGDVNSLVHRLPAVFRMDLGIYRALCLHAFDPEADAPLPQICRICACSEHDPCADSMGEPCGWVPGDPTLCTMCIDREPANDAMEAKDAA